MHIRGPILPKLLTFCFRSLARMSASHVAASIRNCREGLKSDLRRSQIRDFADLRSKRRIRFQEFCDFGDGAVQLRISAAPIIMRIDVDFDIGFCSAVFDLPADIGEPMRKFRLGGDTAVDQAMPRPNSDDAAPGALSDQRTGFPQLEGMAKEIAVRACVFIRDRNHWACRAFIGIGKCAEPARMIGAQPLSTEFFQ